MTSKSREPKRICPSCNCPVYVVKSFTPKKDHAHVERLQCICCSVCGLKGTLLIKEDITWYAKDPDLV